MTESEATLRIPGPIEMADNLSAVSQLGHCYNLDDNYCLYCAEAVNLGDWQFVCNNCHKSVAYGFFPLPACWINELYIEMYGGNAKAFMFSSGGLVKKRPPGVPKGALHNG